MLNAEQQKAVDFREGQCALIAGPGSGKCLAKGTLVLMHSGELRPVEELQINDVLMGPDSTPRKILSLGRGISSLYEIQPVKGESFTCNGEHILVLGYSKKRDVSRHGKVIYCSVNDFLSKHIPCKKDMKLLRAEIDFPEKETKIDPYFFGLWLGDGDSSLSQVTITTVDAPIISYLEAIAKEWGLAVNKKERGGCPSYSICKKSEFSKHSPNILLDEMRKYGVSYNKHIPSIFKNNNREKRLRLLAGLVDSDGYTHNNTIDICSKFEILAQDIVYLCRSLGLAAYVHPCEKKCCNNGVIKKYYRISISGNLDAIPVILKRKIPQPRRQIKNVLHTGFKIIPKGTGEYFGFTLDGDHQFVLGNFTISHNTTCITGRYSALVSEGVWPHEIISLTFTREAAESMMKRASATKDQFCTFHSLGLRIYTAERGAPNVDPEARHRLLAYLSKKWRREYKEIAAFISNCRRNRISVYDAPDENYALAKAYQEYEERRQDEGWIDFDSMLAECISILQNPDVQKRWSFKWVMADEMQDTEPCQLEILRLISQRYGNVFCVGDENQSVYSFRNALTHFEDEMKKIWPATKVLYLSNNYRSHATLVDFIKRKAAHQNPVIQNMTAMRQEKGREIEYRQFSTEYDEAEDAIANILKSKLSDSVVLTRTNRALLPFTVLCSEHDIPFRLLGRSGFWKQHEVQKTLKKLTEVIGWPVSTAISMVFPKIETAYQAEDATVEDNRALENVKAVKDMLRGFSSVADFLAYANKATHAENRKKKTGVTLSTVHQAKGSEFKNVYLADCSIGHMPHDKGEPFEERRIFFVACSRAKDFLRISFTGYPSSFIRPDLTDEALHKMELERNSVERIKCKSE